MPALTLTAATREITGKKVKKLRREGLLPVSVYGKNIKSLSLSVPLKDFLRVYRESKETGLVELKYDGKSQHTLVSHVQIHPVTRQLLHAEFHAVKLTEKVKAAVPLVLAGDSPAVQNNLGILLQTLNNVEVEALPAELPENIAAEVSGLTEVGQQITVGDLPKVKGVEILTSNEEIVVKVAPTISAEAKKEAEEEAKKAAAAATAPVAETGKAETAPAAPPAGETSVEGKLS